MKVSFLDGITFSFFDWENRLMYLYIWIVCIELALEKFAYSWFYLKKETDTTSVIYDKKSVLWWTATFMHSIVEGSEHLSGHEHPFFVGSIDSNFEKNAIHERHHIIFFKKSQLQFYTCSLYSWA
jgi:hypothetical protein